jgi:DnaJ-class molecular chaperone
MRDTEILALDRLLERVDYYRLLRVDKGADGNTIRAGYHRMRRELHPDGYLQAPPELRDALDRIARRLNEAYVVLRDSTRRAAYDRGLGEGELRYVAELAERVKTEREAASGTTPNGKRFYRMAMEALDAKDLPRAASNLKMALTFEPKNEGIRAKLGEIEEELQKTRPAEPKNGASPYTIR